MNLNFHIYQIIKEALSYKLNIPEIYSSEVLKNNALFSLSEALQNIHYSSRNSIRKIS